MHSLRVSTHRSMYLNMCILLCKLHLNEVILTRASVTWRKLTPRGILASFAAVTNDSPRSNFCDFQVHAFTSCERYVMW